MLEGAEEKKHLCLKAVQKVVSPILGLSFRGAISYKIAVFQLLALPFPDTAYFDGRVIVPHNPVKKSFWWAREASSAAPKMRNFGGSRLSNV